MNHGSLEDGNCPHMKTCEMYELLRRAGSLKIWKTLYCTTGFRNCARWQQSRDGLTVCPTLLPNGETILHARPATVATRADLAT